jgi:sugar O-acyltransferase (sialic acid O-acetyltransferase NeuD family)
MKKLIIIGYGGHGRSVEWIAKENKQWSEIFFLDESKSGKNILGKLEDRLKFKAYDFFVGIGDNKTRKSLQEQLISEGFNVVSIVAKNAITTNAKIGIGSIIMNQCLINVDSVIGNGVIINNGSIIEHDCVVQDFTHISPNVSIGGTCNIGKECWLGIGSTVINNISIMSNTIIGAGSTLISSVLASGTYVGIPAKKLT